MASVSIMSSSCKSVRALPPRAVVARRCVSVRAAAPESSSSVVKSAPRKMLEATSKFAGACALAVVLSSSAVEPAEAAKSGGRAGGSAGFSRARSSQPRAPAPTQQAPRVTNNYYGGSPFGFSPFGFSPFGFSPFGFGGGAVVVGAPAAGFSFFSLILDIFLVGAFVTLVTSLFSRFSNNDNRKKDDDGW